jgi:hypothetical protein
MNSKVSYLPGTDADRVIWFYNFSTKIGTYATSLGISTVEVTSVHNDAAFFQFIENMVEVYKQAVNNVVGYKNLVKHAIGQQHLGAIPTLPTLGTPPAAITEGAFDRVQKLVTRIKASVNYTDSLGADLGIIAPSSLIDPNTLQPVLKVRLEAGRPHIKCAKGIADAIDLFVDRKDGNGFVLIGRLCKMDYIDTAVLPAASPLVEWDYKAMYVIGNDSVGIMSLVESVIVKRM